MRDESFLGWSRVWSAEDFARAAWPRLADVEEVSVAAEELAPLVPFASNEALIQAIERYHNSWSDERIEAWLLARGDAIEPALRAMMKRFTRELADEGGTCLNEAETHAMSALGQMLAARGETWGKREAKVVEEELASNRGALAALDPALRGKWLLRAIKDGDIDAEILSWFPSQEIVDALLKAIRREGEGADEALFQALAGQGPLGEPALRAFVGDPRHAVKAIAALPCDEPLALAVLPFFSGERPDLTRAAQAVWSSLPEPLRARLLDAHLAQIPPEHSITLIADMSHRPEALRWAEALPSLPATEPQRRFILSRPGALPALCAEIAEALARAPEAVERARAKLAGLADLDTRDEAVRWLVEAAPPRGVALAVLASRPLESIVPVCKALGLTPDLAWGAVWWWSGDRYHPASSSSLWSLHHVFGAVLLAPLIAAFDEGRLEGAEQATLGILAEHDPVGSWERLVRHVDDTDTTEDIVSAMVTAVNAGCQPAQAWVEAALTGPGSARKVALAVIAKDAGPRWIPALDRALADAPPAKGKRAAKPLTPAAKRDLSSARAACATAGAPLPRSKRALALAPVQLRGAPFRLDAPIDTLGAAGPIRAVLARGALQLFAPWGEHRLEGLSVRALDLSPDGRHLLLWDGDSDIAVHDTTSAATFSAPPKVLHPDSGLSQVIPLPGARVFAVCFAQNSTPLTSWSLESGSEEVHRTSTYVLDLALIDDARYALLTGDGALTLRAVEGGEVLTKLLPARGKEVEDTFSPALALAGARWLFARDDRSALRVWDLAEEKPPLVSSFEAIPEGRLVADPESDWTALLANDEVRLFREGLPVRSLPAPWAPTKATPQPRKCACFLAPGLLALGGAEGLEAWDLAAGEHLGRAARPCRGLTKVAPHRAWSADDKRGLWELSLR